MNELKQNLLFVFFRKKKEYTFFTRLTVEECKQRLNWLLDKEFLREHPIVVPNDYHGTAKYYNLISGKVQNTDFELVIGSYRPFSVIFKGQITKANGITNLSGYTFIGWVVFVIIWSFIFGVTLNIVFFSILKLFINILFLVFLILAQLKLEQYILKILQDLLEASPVTSDER